MRPHLSWLFPPKSDAGQPHLGWHHLVWHPTDSRNAGRLQIGLHLSGWHPLGFFGQISNLPHCERISQNLNLPSATNGPQFTPSVDRVDYRHALPIFHITSIRHVDGVGHGVRQPSPATSCYLSPLLSLSTRRKNQPERRCDFHAEPQPARQRRLRARDGSHHRHTA